MRIGSIPSLIPRELPGLDDAASALRAGAAPGVAKPETAAPASTGGTAAVGGVGKASFSNFLTRAVSEVNDKMQAAQAEQSKVLTGESTNLHQAMISIQEASVAFTMMVEVRNKLVESYQELMRMQI